MPKAEGLQLSPMISYAVLMVFRNATVLDVSMVL